MIIKEGMVVEWKGDELEVIKVSDLSNIIVLVGKKGTIEITKDRFKEYIKKGIIKVEKENIYTYIGGEKHEN